MVLVGPVVGTGPVVLVVGRTVERVTGVPRTEVEGEEIPAKVLDVPAPLAAGPATVPWQPPRPAALTKAASARAPR